ncbi:2,3-butanediol dehydrogenase [Pseudonocardia halophobica]|uniref:Alcohol dehydrogenase n=1 Tax=Pseudonocardia halophobica TaxID=29401 RepID=A0A9W6P0Z3_9PSEU|nr:alcohol dehydrogenase [Pseudonocardia halophobica]
MLAPDRTLVVREVTRPDPGPGEVLLDVAYAGVCGSDLHRIYDWDPVPAGSVLGHEFSGRVAGLGADVVGWSAGDRVTVLPVDPCGACPACSGRGGICRAGLARGPGLGRPGGYAEAVVVPAGMLVRLPDGVDDQAGAFVEPLAVACRAVRQSGARPGSRVAVLGGGPIGLTVALVLRARGAEAVRLVEPNPARRERAAASAPVAEDLAVAVDELGHPLDVVLDCTGHFAAATGAFPFVRDGATVVVVGLCGTPATVDLGTLVRAEIVLRGTLAYERQDFDAAIAALAEGAVPWRSVVTDVRPLEQANAVVRDLHGTASPQLKVLLSPTG